MNTFELNTNNATLINEFSSFEQGLIINHLEAAIAAGDLVSIQLQEVFIASATEEEPEDLYELQVYGLYNMSPEDVSRYDRSGGLWDYTDPAGLLGALKAL